MDRNRLWRYDEEDDDFETNRYHERNFDYDRNRPLNRGEYDYGRGRSGYGWQNDNRGRYGSEMEYGDQGYTNQDWGRQGRRNLGDYGFHRGLSDDSRSRAGSDYGYTRGRGMTGGYGRSRAGSDYDWDTGYDQGFDAYDTWDMDSPATWNHTEFWLIPGPETGRGPAGYQRSDERIREDINERLTQHGRLNAANIQVEVDNCTVTLKGTVNNRPMKRMSEDVADSVMGVRDVNNQLKVQDQNRQTESMPTNTQTTGRQRQQGENGGQNQTTATPTSRRK
jgi:hypothetical protein